MHLFNTASPLKAKWSQTFVQGNFTSPVSSDTASKITLLTLLIEQFLCQRQEGCLLLKYSKRKKENVLRTSKKLGSRTSTKGKWGTTQSGGSFAVATDLRCQRLLLSWCNSRIIFCATSILCHILTTNLYALGQHILVIFLKWMPWSRMQRRPRSCRMVANFQKKN